MTNSLTLTNYISIVVLLFCSGVLAQENLPEDIFAQGSSYIAASYVKYLEGSGARVAPIRYSDYHQISNLI